MNSPVPDRAMVPSWLTTSSRVRAESSALASAWIPALVFGIPGDSITAIAIGVLYLKDMNPGPTLFVNNPQNIYAVFIVFILAQLLMLPLGWMAIKAAKRILHIPASVLMPLILLFCVVGSFAINNSMFGVIVMLIAGMIPIALGIGPGTASRASIAMVIIGGQTLSLVLSLLVTPVAYTYFDDVTRWWSGPAASEPRGELPHA